MRDSRIKPAVRAIGWAIALAALCFFVVSSLAGPDGVPALLEKQREIRRLQEVNAKLQSENELKRRRIEKLREDRSEQELEIRRRLKLLKKEETSFILHDQHPEPQETPAP